MRRRRESVEKVLAMSSGAGFSLRIETQWIGDKKKIFNILLHKES